MKNLLALVLFLSMIAGCTKLTVDAIVRTDELRDNQRHERYEQQQRTKATTSARLAPR